MFQRNIGALTEEEQKSLQEKAVFVAGCGGLGGFVVEFLTRVGVGKLVVCDKDKFEKSNANRQLLCTADTLGKSKAEAARERAKLVNPSVSVTVMDMALTAKNAEFLLDNVDVVVDCLDSAEARYILEKTCDLLQIPFVTGAVDQWMGQVAAVYPEDGTVSRLYGENGSVSIMNAQKQDCPSVLSFSAACVASCQAAEAVKVLLGRPSLRNKVLLIDLEDFSFNVMQL